MIILPPSPLPLITSHHRTGKSLRIVDILLNGITIHKFLQHLLIELLDPHVNLVAHNDVGVHRRGGLPAVEPQQQTNSTVASDEVLNQSGTGVVFTDDSVVPVVVDMVSLDLGLATGGNDAVLVACHVISEHL